MRKSRRAIQSALAFYSGVPMQLPGKLPKSWVVSSRPEAACLLEVKAPGGRPSEAQAFFLERVRASGGMAFIATSAADVNHNLMETI